MASLPQHPGKDYILSGQTQTRLSIKQLVQTAKFGIYMKTEGGNPTKQAYTIETYGVKNTGF